MHPLIPMRTSRLYYSLVVLAIAGILYVYYYLGLSTLASIFLSDEQIQQYFPKWFYQSFKAYATYNIMRNTIAIRNLIILGCSSALLLYVYNTKKYIRLNHQNANVFTICILFICILFHYQLLIW